MNTIEDTPFSQMIDTGPLGWPWCGGSSPDESKDAQLQQLYGITLDEFQIMVEAQRGLCAICSVLMVLNGSHANSVNVDHDHTTGRVRGLLCHSCNIALTRVEKDLAWGIKAAHYLHKFVRNQTSQKSEDSKLEVLTCQGLVAPTHNTNGVGNPYSAGDSPQSCGSRNN